VVAVKGGGFGEKGKALQLFPDASGKTMIFKMF
jgi:hypothetical protein